MSSLEKAAQTHNKGFIFYFPWNHGCIFCQKIKKFPQQQFQNQKVSPLAFSQNVKVSPLVVFQKVKVSPLVDSGLPKT